MDAPRVYADFQNLDEASRLRLTCAGTHDDLNRQGIRLEEGLRLTFSTDDADDTGEPDDLWADGIVHFDDVEGCWVATLDWNAVRHASDEVRQAAGR